MRRTRVRWLALLAPLLALGGSAVADSGRPESPLRGFLVADSGESGSAAALPDSAASGSALSEPAVSVPAVSELEVSEPAPSGPAASEPAVSEPAVGAPVLGASHGAKALSPEEQRGQKLFEQGQGASAEEVRATFGNGLELPGSAARCAGCHGEDGTGRPEAGILPADIRWSQLTRSYGHRHADGVRHGPFDRDSLATYLRTGVLPGGARGDGRMPRYQLAEADLADLVSYLERLGELQDPGVSNDAVQVMLLVPAEGALEENGDAIREVVQASFELANRGGGLYGRRLTLRVRGVRKAELRDVEALVGSIREGRPFAVLSPLTPLPERELYASLSQAGIPVLAPQSSHAELDYARNRWLFQLSPGLEEQVALLLEAELRGRRGDAMPLGLVAPANTDPAARGSMLEKVLRRRDLTWAYRGSCDALSARPRQEMERVRHAEVGILVSLCGEAELARGLDATSRLGTLPRVLAPGELAGRLLARRLRTSGKSDTDLILAFPSWASDRSRAALETLARATEASAVVSRHPREAIDARVGALLLAEGIKRAGRNLTRLRLAQALESLYDFDTGLMRPIGFDKNRRIGSPGVYRVTARNLLPGNESPDWIAFP